MTRKQLPADRGWRRFPVAGSTPHKFRPRFTLADLLLFTTVVAVVAAAAARVSGDVWRAWQGLFFLAILGSGWTSYLVCLAVDYGKQTGLDHLAVVRRQAALPDDQRRYNQLLMPGAVVLAFLATSLGLVLFDRSCRYSGPGLAVAQLGQNGYEDLVRAGVRLGRRPAPNGSETPQFVLQQWAKDQAKVLDLARQALDGPCQVSLTYTHEDQWRKEPTMIANVGGGFLAEARLAELEGVNSKAVDRYADVLGLVRAMENGGIFEDWFAASELAWDAIGQMAGSIGRMDPKALAQADSILEAYDTGREPLDSLIRRATAHRERSEFLMERAGALYSNQPLIEPKLIAGARSTYLGDQCLVRLLRTEIALARYERDHGAPPDRLAALVPDYLDEVPIEPFSGEPLGYARTDSGHNLSSVGPKGDPLGGLTWQDPPDVRAHLKKLGWKR